MSAVTTVPAELPEEHDGAATPDRARKLRRRIVAVAALLYLAPLPLWVVALWAGQMLPVPETLPYLLSGAKTAVPFTLLCWFVLDRCVSRWLDAVAGPGRLRRADPTLLPVWMLGGQIVYGVLAPPVAALGYRLTYAQPVPFDAHWLSLAIVALLVMVIPAMLLLHHISRLVLPLVEPVADADTDSGFSSPLGLQLLIGAAITVPVLSLCLVVSVTLSRASGDPAVVSSTLVLVAVVVLACLYGLRLSSRHFRESLRAVRRVAETGDLRTQIPVQAADEFGVLAMAFNRMLRRLRDTVAGRDYLEALLSSVGDALLVVGGDGRIRRCGPVARAWWQSPDAGDLIGRSAAALFETTHAGLVGGAVSRCLSVPSHRETLSVRSRTQGGERMRELQLTLSSVASGRDPNPDDPVCLILARDVTAALEQQRELEQSVARYRTLAENNAAAIYQMGLDGELQYANPTLRRLLGLGEGEISADTRYSHFVTASGVEVVRGNLSRRSEGESTTYELELLSASGERRQMLVSGAPLRDAAGVVTGSLGMMIDVSDLAEARRALQESENRYRALAETSAAGIYQVLPDGTLTYANAAMTTLLGLDSDAAAPGVNIIAMMTPESREQVAAAQPLRAQGESSSYEVELIQVGGQRRRLSLHGAPVMDADGNYRSAVGVAIDITEQVEVRDRLLDNEARFRALSETGGAAIMQTDYEGRVLYANQAARDLFGMDDAGALGRYDWRALMPGGTAPSGERETRSGRDGDASTYLADLDTVRRGRRQMLVSGAPVRDADGANRSAVIVMVDVTDRETALRALRESEGKYRALAEHAVAGIWQIDPEGRSLYLNPAMRRMVGIDTGTPLEAIRFADFLDSESAAPPMVDQRQVRVDGWISGRSEIRLRARSGVVRDVLVSGAGIYDAAGALVSQVGSFIDVTELRQALATVQQQMTELESKNRELEEFNYVASHDLQEPLRTIISFGELLREDLGDALNPRAEEDLTYITDGANRLRVLIQDLLELSRSGRRRMNEDLVALGDCARTAIADLRQTIEESGAQVHLAELPIVQGNAAALTRVFANLISNGIKFSAGDAPRVGISACVQDGQVEITVRDNGIGIEADHLQQIFQPFKRLHSRARYEGSGIGLAICQRLVERHGGTIWAESDKAGSAIRFTLPLPPAAALAAAGRESIELSHRKDRNDE